MTAVPVAPVKFKLNNKGCLGSLSFVLIPVRMMSGHDVHNL